MLKPKHRYRREMRKKLLWWWLFGRKRQRPGGGIPENLVGVDESQDENAVWDSQLKDWKMEPRPKKKGV